MTHATVTIQITSESKPSTPSWMGEVAAFAQILEHTGTLKVVQNQVRFARARFGHYDLIDFVAVLIGYILSSEPTLLAFYEQLAPFAEPFMALFGRNRLPHRSTLLAQIPHLLLIQPLPHFLLLRCCGATGHVVVSGEPGSRWSAAKPSAWKAPLCSRRHRHKRLRRRS